MKITEVQSVTLIYPYQTEDVIAQIKFMSPICLVYTLQSVMLSSSHLESWYRIYIVQVTLKTNNKE